jgi:arsenite methyltransferase
MKEYLKINFNSDNLPEVYDELPLWSAPFGLRLLEEVIYKQNLNVLDIGFGTGFPITELAMRLGSTSKVYGIDPWTKAFDRVQKKISYYGITNIILFKGEAESIPLKSKSIDLIVSNNGINNVRNIKRVIKECSRIIKPGGQFVMTLNLDRTLIEFYTLLEKILHEMQLFKNIEEMHKHIYSKRRPLEEITELLTENDFAIKNQQFDSFRYKFASGTAFFNHYFIRLAFMGSWIDIIPPEKTNQIFDTLESTLNTQAAKNLAISMTIPFVTINVMKLIKCRN